MSRIFAIADIHGAYKPLLECLEKSNFDYKQDILICLGDTVDGYPEVKECFDELLKIKNLIYILGNHDSWFLEWAICGIAGKYWTSQGGEATLKSYNYIRTKVPESHIKLLQEAPYYYVLTDKKTKEKTLFVHGGIDANTNIKEQDGMQIMWDRELIESAYRKSNSRPNYRLQDKYKEIFIGHTTTEVFNSLKPIKFCEVWDIDTGAGWSGKLSLINVETKEVFQSEESYTYYPYHTPRG